MEAQHLRGPFYLSSGAKKRRRASGTDLPVEQKLWSPEPSEEAHNSNGNYFLFGGRYKSWPRHAAPAVAYRATPSASGAAASTLSAPSSARWLMVPEKWPREQFALDPAPSLPGVAAFRQGRIYLDDLNRDELAALSKELDMIENLVKQVMSEHRAQFEARFPSAGTGRGRSNKLGALEQDRDVSHRDNRNDDSRCVTQGRLPQLAPPEFKPLAGPYSSTPSRAQIVGAPPRLCKKYAYEISGREWLQSHLPDTSATGSPQRPALVTEAKGAAAAATEPHSPSHTDSSRAGAPYRPSFGYMSSLPWRPNFETQHIQPGWKRRASAAAAAAITTAVHSTVAAATATTVRRSLSASGLADVPNAEWGFRGRERVPELQCGDSSDMDQASPGPEPRSTVLDDYSLFEMAGLSRQWSLLPPWLVPSARAAPPSPRPRNGRGGGGGGGSSCGGSALAAAAAANSATATTITAGQPPAPAFAVSGAAGPTAAAASGLKGWMDGAPIPRAGAMKPPAALLLRQPPPLRQGPRPGWQRPLVAIARADGQRSKLAVASGH